MDAIALLTAQYLQQVDPPSLSLPDGPSIVSPAIQTAIYENMFNDDTTWPLPPVPYQTRVLKTIIARIEESISDPEEDPSSIEQAQQLTYIKYTAPTPSTEPSKSEKRSRAIITSENRSLILSAGTTGFRTWEAALHLGTFLSTTDYGASLIAGKRVLELGAGTGFLSFLAARHLGADSVIVTDREPALIEQINSCIEKNGLDASKIRAGIWEWGMPLQVPSSASSYGETQREQSFDVALGADLIYDIDLVPLLVSTIRDLFDNYALKHFIISATVRNEDTFRAFLDTCKRNRLAVEQLPFQSPPSEQQTGFFHSTNIPIRTYRVKDSLS